MKTSLMRAPMKGFTLVELLVVIAIIAILAAILMPAMNAALKKASVAQAQTEVKSIEAAMKAYLNEYSRFPHMTRTGDRTYGYGAPDTNNWDLINTLRSVSGNGNVDGTNNVRGIILLEVSESSLGNGNFIDPWGNVYNVTCDTDFNNACVPADAASYAVTNRNVVVWSRGPDSNARTSDDVTSWK